MTYRIAVIQKGFLSRELYLWKVKSYTLEYEENTIKLTTVGNNGNKIIRIFDKNSVYQVTIKETEVTNKND